MQEGDTVIVSLDRNTSILKWFKNGTEVASTLLAEHMKKDSIRLVPYFQLNYAHNEIYLNEDPSEEFLKEVRN